MIPFVRDEIESGPQGYAPISSLILRPYVRICPGISRAHSSFHADFSSPELGTDLSNYDKEIIIAISRRREISCYQAENHGYGRCERHHDHDGNNLWLLAVVQRGQSNTAQSLRNPQCLYSAISPRSCPPFRAVHARRVKSIMEVALREKDGCTYCLGRSYCTIAG